MMQVQVVYPLPHRQTLITVEVPKDCTVVQAITLSGLLECHPELQLSSLTIGVFGQICALDQQLHPGDRVEIYRPRLFDPKLAWRVRARTTSIRPAHVKPHPRPR